MEHLHIADFAVLAAFFLTLIIIGVVTSRWIKTTYDFFMPRKFGKILMVMFSFGAGTNSDQAVAVASKSFTNGLSGIWYHWLWLFVTPFYWLIAPLFRRFRAVTTADVFEARYDSSVGILYTVVGLATLVASLGVMLKGLGEVLSASVGGTISAEMVIAVTTFVFVIYGVAGGLSAAIITDFLQGILTIVFSFMLLPLILNAVGGIAGIRSAIHDPSKLSLVAAYDITIFFVAVVALNGLIIVVTRPDTMAMCGAARTEMEARVGLMGGNFLKRICTIPWALTGLAALVYYSGQHVEPDKVFGKVACDFLPQLFPGALGFFIAATLASVMDTCGAFMISSSALFTENFYKKIVIGKSQNHYVHVARVASIIIVLFGVAFAYCMPSVIAALEVFWKVSQMGIAFWLGLFWQRATAAGAWASTLAGFAAWGITSSQFCVALISKAPLSESLGYVVQNGACKYVYLPWQIVFYSGASLLAGIVVSLLSKPVSKEKLDNFYALIRTPVAEGEIINVSCRLPANAAVPPPRTVRLFENIEIPIPSRTSVAGFAAGWVIACVLVYFVYAIMN